MTCGRPVPGFAAFSGTGRATLLVRLMPFLEERGVRVPLIKQAHHDFDIDKPGKDSCDLRKAGTRQVTVASNRRSALVTENTVPAEPRGRFNYCRCGGYPVGHGSADPAGPERHHRDW